MKRVDCGRRSNAAHSEEGVPADKQPSHTLARMSKTTRFADGPAQDSPTPLPGGALTASNSGIPTGATAQWWMATRLAPALGGTHMLLLALAFTIIGLQVYSAGMVVHFKPQHLACCLVYTESGAMSPCTSIAASCWFIKPSKTGGPSCMCICNMLLGLHDQQWL